MVKDALPSALLNDALYMLMCDVTLKWSFRSEMSTNGKS